MSGWPRGLRRQTQEYSLFLWLQRSILVHECGRGFESHFWQGFSDNGNKFKLINIRCRSCENSPPSRIWTSDLEMPVSCSQLQSPALTTELWVGLTFLKVSAITYLRTNQSETQGRDLTNKVWYVAEGGFDPPTSGLWAQHASSAPLCWLALQALQFLF